MIAWPKIRALILDENSVQIHETLGNALYWFIFLLFLPPIFDALALKVY